MARDRFSPDELIYHVELWSHEGRAEQLFAAAAEKDLAVAMARAAQEVRATSKVRLIVNPAWYGFMQIDRQALPFQLERWRADLGLMERLLGLSAHVTVARAAYRAALDVLPGPMLLRQGGHVLADSTRGDV